MNKWQNVSESEWVPVDICPIMYLNVDRNRLRDLGLSVISYTENGWDNAPGATARLTSGRPYVFRRLLGVKPDGEWTLEIVHGDTVFENLSEIIKVLEISEKDVSWLSPLYKFPAMISSRIIKT